MDLRNKLKDIEWIELPEETEITYETCPICNGHKHWGNGHKPDCWLAEQISKIEGVE
jgi:hypothetical protein